MLKLYGNPYSRANRVRWALEEAGVDFTEEEIALGKDGTRSEDFLAINPNGHVPVIDDNGLVLFESVPICLYIAKKYSPNDLYVETVDEEGQVLQWSVWAMTELERQIETASLHSKWLPEDMRDGKKAAAAQEKIRDCVGMIKKQIANGGYLVGDAFGIADLVVCEVLTSYAHCSMDPKELDAVGAYLSRNLARPAAKAAFASDIIEPFA